MTRILGVDPGHTTGWAILNEDGHLEDYGQVHLKRLNEFLDGLSNIGVFVMENFKIRPGVNFSWSEMDTIQILGMFKYRAHQLGAEVVLQEPASYRVGAKWAGKKIPRDHSVSHQVIAYAHAVFYSVYVLKRQPPVLQSSHEHEHTPQDPQATSQARPEGDGGEPTGPEGEADPSTG